MIPMPKPLASITLTTSDLVRLASPRLLTACPDLGRTEWWKFKIAHLPDGGVRLDVIAPAEENGK